MATQSFLKAGFFKAVQVEPLFIIGESPSVTKTARFESFRNSVPKYAFRRYIHFNREFFVNRDHDPPAEGAASFHTTHWTIVMRAAQSCAQGGQAALAELCRLYWYPLYIFAWRRGHSPEDAQDLTQGFFLHLLEHHAPTGVDRLKGKFRSFLLASFTRGTGSRAVAPIASARTRCLQYGALRDYHAAAGS